MALMKPKTTSTTNHKDAAEQTSVVDKTVVDSTVEPKQTKPTVAEQAAEQKAKIAAEEAQYEEEDAAANAAAEAEEYEAAQAAEAKAKADEAKAQAAKVKAAKVKADKVKADKAAAELAEKEAADLAAAELAAQNEANQSDVKGNEMPDENVVADQDVQEEVTQKDVVTEAKSEPTTIDAETETETSNEVATVDTKKDVVVKSAGGMPANITELAADEGFEGTELGFGSFPVIKLPGEGVFNDSDDNELGKHIRASLQQSKEVFLYKQEDNNDGDVGYSYDGVNLSAFNGDEDYKTVAELKKGWSDEGYETETKKYLEVIGVICEDHAKILGGEVPEGLEDLQGEPVIFSIPPSSVKAFSGKCATLTWAGKPIKGAVMDFMVGKKRTNGANKYFPWKFRLVK